MKNKNYHTAKTVAVYLQNPTENRRNGLTFKSKNDGLILSLV